MPTVPNFRYLLADSSGVGSKKFWLLFLVVTISKNSKGVLFSIVTISKNSKGLLFEIVTIS